MTRRWAVVFGVGLLSAVTLMGGTSAQQPAGRNSTRTTDEAALRKADEDWAKAAQTRQVAAWVAFYASDAVVQPPNDKIATDKASIEKAVSSLLNLPDLMIGWQPAKVEVARSRDLAYVRGTYDASWKDNTGKSISDRGKYLEVWRKQPGGGWKCIVDTWNSDLPS